MKKWQQVRKWQLVVGIEVLALAVVLTMVFFLTPSAENRQIVCSNDFLDLAANLELKEEQEENDNNEQEEEQEPIIKEICIPEPEEDIQNDSKTKLEGNKRLTSNIDVNTIDILPSDDRHSDNSTSDESVSDTLDTENTDTNVSDTNKPDSKPEDSKPEDNKPGDSKPDIKPGPIEIDTSKWIFNKIDVVYDGKEHEAYVSGLPSWVTPVYKDNKRTDAGTNKAYVSFIVPEGYKQPKDMETDIIIRKAEYNIALSENDIQMLGNDEFRIAIAEDRIPEGVEVSYLVNGSEVDKDYILSGPGQYIVTAKFTHSNPNYEPINDSEVLYVKKEEAIKNQTYELILKQVASKDNEIKVELYLNCIYSSAYGFQATMKYDPYLKFQEIELNEEQWNYYTFNENTGYIYFTANNTSSARDMSFIGTMTFTMSEEEKIAAIEWSNIMVIDRGWGMHNIDPVAGVVSKIPQYEVASLNTILSDGEIESCIYNVAEIQIEEIDISKNEIESSDEAGDEAEETDVSKDEIGDSDESVDETEETDVSKDEIGDSDESVDETEETDVSKDEIGDSDEAGDETEETDVSKDEIGDSDEAGDETEETDVSKDEIGGSDEAGDETEETDVSKDEIGGSDEAGDEIEKTDVSKDETEKSDIPETEIQDDRILELKKEEFDDEELEREETETAEVETQ